MKYDYRALSEFIVGCILQFKSETKPNLLCESKMNDGRRVAGSCGFLEENRILIDLLIEQMLSAHLEVSGFYTPTSALPTWRSTVLPLI